MDDVQLVTADSLPLSAEEVVRRWKKLYPGKRELDGEPGEPDAETIAAQAVDEKSALPFGENASAISAGI